MVKVYAVVLAAGVLALITWIFVSYLAGNADSFQGLDPENKWGKGGRRVVAAMVGFGMAGLSAEFSPRNIAWPLALTLALAGAGAAVWYAGWIGRDKDPAQSAESGGQ